MVGSEFHISTHTTNHQAYPSLTSLSDGGFVASWSSGYISGLSDLGISNQDGSGGGIFAQIFDTGTSSSSAGLTINSSTNALTAITAIDTAIKTVNTQRSELGAISNRLSHTVNNLTNISANLSAAKGVIEDADFAHETSNLAKNQILQQASTAMLAQANASKQNVLSLLQG